MTTTAASVPAVPADRARDGDRPGLAEQARWAVGAEWVKLRSVRSTVIALLVTVIVCVGFAVLVALAALSRWDRFSPHDRLEFHPATLSVSGVFFAQIVLGALGVLAMSAEYSTGTIRATLAATPQRLVAYLAKLATFGAVALAVTLITMTVSFLVAQAILARKHLGVGLLDSPSPRIVVGSALFLVCVAMLGLGLATLLRHSAGAISALFCLILVLPLLSNFLPDDWQSTMDKWLPLNAGMSVMRTQASEPNQFGPWTGLGVLAGYALISLAGGAVVLCRRDA